MPVRPVRLLPFLILGALLLLGGFSAPFSAAVSDRIALCLNELIPALFGCTVLAALLFESGAADTLCNLLAPCSAALSLPPAVLPVFLVSQLAGYPAGAMLLAREAESGRMKKDDAARFSCICYGGGPAFLIGLSGRGLLMSPAAGWLLMLCCLLSNFAMLLLFRGCTGGFPPPHTERPPFPAAVTGAVHSAMRTLSHICGTVLLFGILLRAAELLHVFRAAALVFGIPAHTVQAVLSAFCDITQLGEITRCGFSFRTQLVLFAALLSFGGICAQMQCAALGTVRLARLFCMRLPAALLAALLLMLLSPLVPVPPAAAVFAQIHAVSQTGSPLPAVFILLTGMTAAFTSRGEECRPHESAVCRRLH